MSSDQERMLAAAEERIKLGSQERKDASLAAKNTAPLSSSKRSPPLTEFEHPRRTPPVGLCREPSLSAGQKGLMSTRTLLDEVRAILSRTA